MIGLLTIIQMPKGGKLLIAYSSLTEDGNTYKGDEMLLIFIRRLFYVTVAEVEDATKEHGVLYVEVTL